MSVNATSAAPTGRKKAIDHRSLANGDAAKPPAALGHECQNTSSPDGADESPTGWKSAPLGELCERITKGSSPNWQGFDYCDSGIIFVRSQNVGWGDLKLGEVAHLPAAFNEKEKKSVLKTDAVLLNLVGASIGRACVATSEVDGGNVNQAVAVIRVQPEVLTPKFLVHFLISPPAQARIHSEKVDVARANFSLEDTRSLSIPLPPVPEQRRIVAEIEKQFTRLEAGVAALRRVQANLKRYRAAVLKAACEGKLVPTEAELQKSEGRGQKSKAKFETGAALLARILTERRQDWQRRGKYKEPAAPDTANLPAIPDGWSWASIEQLGEVQLGRQRSPKNVSKNYPTKYIRAANITERGIDVSDVLEMEFSPAERERFALRRGDIVLSEASGSPSQVGKPAVWRDELPLCCFQNTVLRLRPVGVQSKYVLVTFQHFYANSVFAKVAGGVDINHLGAEKFSAIPFPLPPLAEQMRIVAEVERRLRKLQNSGWCRRCSIWSQRRARCRRSPSLRTP